MKEHTYIRFDWAMKRMLRDKANFAVLEGLLTVLLEESIHIVEILESEGNQQTYYARADIKARNSKGEIVLIEIQNIRELYFLERLLYGGVKTITKYINSGDSFRQIKKVYSIAILYFNRGKGSDYIYHGQNQFIGVHTKDRLLISQKEENAIIQKLPSDVFPEYYLIRVNEFNKVAKTALEEWMHYLKTGIINPEDTAPGLPEARQILDYYRMSQADRIAYERHLDAIMIQNDILEAAKMEGREEGRAERQAEEKTVIAQRMKANGLPIEFIRECTGLSLEDIERI